MSEAFVIFKLPAQAVRQTDDKDLIRRLRCLPCLPNVMPRPASAMCG